jgi:ArsR family transcriptional regulator, arsenate/arsenite/antimonite-responsive transcriptional repressor / arsenate reductase (thioredoxin)
VPQVERVRPRGELAPPDFLQLAGHPLRWRLLSELARSDRQVRELTRLLGQPQSLVSYHLGQLRRSRLVSMRRSSADGRDAYYSIDLPRCGDLLAAAGTALHPGLRLPAPPPPGPGGQPTRARVLFLCTGNGTRSQLAEALTRHLSGGAVDAVSAGSHPRQVHPNAIRVMREHGIDLSAARSKHLDTFTGQHFDYVITLCDKVREICPGFPGCPQLIHWSIADPARGGGTDEETYPAFQAAAAGIETRVGFLLRLIQHTPSSQEVH